LSRAKLHTPENRPRDEAIDGIVGRLRFRGIRPSADLKASLKLLSSERH
jgi:hypothetical protein